jgi:hypothetical protein
MSESATGRLDHPKQPCRHRLRIQMRGRPGIMRRVSAPLSALGTAFGAVAAAQGGTDAEIVINFHRSLQPQAEK